MAETYGVTNDVPGDSVTVRSGSTVTISAAFITTLGLVGGMDVANGDADPGTVQTIQSSSDATTAFGENSELKKQVDLAFSQAQPPSTIYAVGVAETQTTENFASSVSGTLSNVPVFDPNVQEEHEITETNQGHDVKIVYEDPSTTTVSADTINLNPITGEWEADTSGTYDIQYTYGDYAEPIEEVAKFIPRQLGVLTENPSIITDALAEANTYDTGFDFMHVQAGATPGISAVDFSQSYNDRRLSIVTASRGYIDAAGETEVRTIGATAGKQAGKALGDSTTYEGLNGLQSLRTDHTYSEISTLTDAGAYPVKKDGGIKIIKDLTTSDDVRFERIYASEIIDEATEISHLISEGFVGTANTETNRVGLEESHDSSYAEMEDDNLLQNYFVEVNEGATDFEVEVDVGLDVIGVMDTIDVTITVGDVITNEGAT